MKFTFLPGIQSIKRGTTVMCCVCRMLPGQDQDAGDRVGRGAEQRRAFERSHHAQSRSGPTEPLHRVMLFCRVLSLTCALFAFQVDQLRSELMQERSARHDLEMDKSAIERQVRVNKKTNKKKMVAPDLWSFPPTSAYPAQVKELKSRVADMEGQTRPSAGIAVLESKIQELEERLRSEER